MPFDVRDLLFLSRITGVGPARLRTIVNHFQSPGAALAATAKQLHAAGGLDRKTCSAVAAAARNPSMASLRRAIDDQLSRLNRQGGRIVTLWHKEYPANLRKIYDPPPILYVRGAFSPLDDYSVAIVGTRAPSPYGAQIAEHLAGDLARLGLPVVSGLARGVDTCAHRAALSKGGRTLAVIGSGLDVMYPPENLPLSESIAVNGAVISECEMGAKPDAANFPRRNRIISGLSIATIVVETGPEGGAMITAGIALDQGREVFAVPAPVQEGHPSGANLLVKQGKAQLLDTIDDLLVEFAPRLHGVLKADHVVAPLPLPELTLFERRLLDMCGDAPTHIDDIARRAGFTAADTLVTLLSLEFKALVRQLPGKFFTRTR